MGGWIDRWAKRAATGSTPRAHLSTTNVDDAPPPSGVVSTSSADVGSDGFPAASGNGSSRRDFMKKAAVVGAAVWSVPVMQSALAPAASASGGNALGDPCSKSAPCVAPLSCGSGQCGGTGAVCGGAAALCMNGGCRPNGLCAAAGQAPRGSTCSANTACRYANCHNGVCGSPGATCGQNNQCLYNNCSGAICGGTGASCGNSGTKCASGVCLPNHKCQ